MEKPRLTAEEARIRAEARLEWGWPVIKVRADLLDQGADPLVADKVIRALQARQEARMRGRGALDLVLAGAAGGGCAVCAYLLTVTTGPATQGLSLYVGGAMAFGLAAIVLGVRGLFRLLQGRD